MSSDKKGYVYILSNPSLDDIKVGFTERAVETRMKDLGGTALPTPFNKEYEVLVHQPKEVEKTAHKILGKFRTNERREFFGCEPIEAYDAIAQAIKSLGLEILYEENNIVDYDSPEWAFRQFEKNANERGANIGCIFGALSAILIFLICYLTSVNWSWIGGLLVPFLSCFIIRAVYVKREIQKEEKRQRKERAKEYYQELKQYNSLDNDD